MRIDVHFHALGTGTDWGAALRADAVFRNADDNHHWVTRITTALVERDLEHGSDFPVPADARAYLPYLVPGISPAEYWQMCRCQHRLDADVLVKRALGFPDSVLSRATEVLRLPDEHRP